MSTQDSNLPAKRPEAAKSQPYTDEEAVRDFVAVRREEIAFEGRRLEQMESSEQRAHQYAMAALEVRKGENEHLHSIYGRTTIIRIGTAALAIMVVLGLISYCVVTDRTDFAKQLIEVIALFGGGLGAGYAVGYRKGKNEVPSSDDDG